MNEPRYETVIPDAPEEHVALVSENEQAVRGDANLLLSEINAKLDALLLMNDIDPASVKED